MDSLVYIFLKVSLQLLLLALTLLLFLKVKEPSTKFRLFWSLYLLSLVVFAILTILIKNILSGGVVSLIFEIPLTVAIFLMSRKFIDSNDIYQLILKKIVNWVFVSQMLLLVYSLWLIFNETAEILSPFIEFFF